MPQLRFETTTAPTDNEEFTAWIAERFADVMETGTGHVGVSVRVCEPTALALGRAGSSEDVVLVDADIRAGRSGKQRRELAASIIEYVVKQWHVPEENVYLVYTEHPGEDFHLAEGSLTSWTETEAETGAGRQDDP